MLQVSFRRFFRVGVRGRSPWRGQGGIPLAGPERSDGGLWHRSVSVCGHKPESCTRQNLLDPNEVGELHCFFHEVVGQTVKKTRGRRSRPPCVQRLFFLLLSFTARRLNHRRTILKSGSRATFTITGHSPTANTKTTSTHQAAVSIS